MRGSRQIDIQSLNYGYRGMSHWDIPLLSNQFTGRREVIAKLENHFFIKMSWTRKPFLLYGMEGIGKTQVCLKFIEERSDW